MSTPPSRIIPAVIYLHPIGPPRRRFHLRKGGLPKIKAAEDLLVHHSHQKHITAYSPSPPRDLRGDHGRPCTRRPGTDGSEPPPDRGCFPGSGQSCDGQCTQAPACSFHIIHRLSTGAEQCKMLDNSARPWTCKNVLQILSSLLCAVPAFTPRAITSGQNKKPAPTLPIQEVIGTGLTRSTGHVGYSRDILLCSSDTRGSGWRHPSQHPPSGWSSACSWDRHTVRSLWQVYHSVHLFANLFATFLCDMKENILTPETEKNRKAILFSVSACGSCTVFSCKFLAVCT